MRVDTIGNIGSKIMLVGEAPGEQEDTHGVPFYPAAPAGGLLMRMLALPEIGLSRFEVVLANVARNRPPANNMKLYFQDKHCMIPTNYLKSCLDDLKKDIIKYNPNIIVALGDHAMWALIGIRGIEKYRGYIYESSLVPGKKVIPTYHPAFILREWKHHFTAVLDLQKAVNNSGSPEIKPDKRKLITSPSFRETIEYYNYLIKERKTIAFDIESNPNTCSIHTIGVAPSEEEAFTFVMVNSADGKPKYSPETELEYWLKLQEVLDVCPVIMHNGKYDMGVLWSSNKVLIKNFYFDTMIATHVLYPECPRNLGYVSSIATNYAAWKHTSQQNNALYNAMDAANTFACYKFLNKKLDKGNFRGVFNFEMMQNAPALMLELQGVYFDKEKAKELIAETTKKIEENAAIISSYTNRPVLKLDKSNAKESNVINLASPKQLSSLLYVELGLPVQYKRLAPGETEKKVTTDAMALKALSIQIDNPILKAIMDYKKAVKLLTFLSIDTSPESRVHTSYNITGATMSRTSKSSVVDDEDDYKSFGRWSSSKSIIKPYGSGNLQNIPEFARKCYTIPKGKILIRADYVQAEAVVVAYLIGDQKLIKMFQDTYGMPRSERKGKRLDVHYMTAAMMYQKDIHEITKEERQKGKTIRHGKNYSMGIGAVAIRLGVKFAIAKKLMQMFDDGCPQLKQWHKSIQQTLNHQKYLTNLLGRTHHFLSRWGDELFRSAYSFIPQSTIGDLLNKALNKMYYDYNLDIYLQLHDAVYVLADDNEEDIKRVRDIMYNCMKIPLECNDKTFYVDADFAYGYSWGDLKEVD